MFYEACERIIQLEDECSAFVDSEQDERAALREEWDYWADQKEANDARMYWATVACVSITTIAFVVIGIGLWEWLA